MELIAAIAIPFLVVVLCAWFRFKPSFNLRPVPTAALMVVLTGSALGSDFFSLDISPIPITLDRLLIAATVGLFGVLVLLGKEDLRKLNRVDAAILALMVVAFFSTVTHNWKFLDNMPASRLLFFNLLPCALYWVVRSCDLRTQELKFIATVLGLFGIYLALTAIAEVKDLPSLVFPRYIMNSETHEFLGRGRGPFLNPVSNGIFMITCFCCILMWWPRTTSMGKAIAMALCVILAIGIYSTLTRSVWLAFVAGCGLFIWLPAQRPAKAAMILVATVIAIVSWPVLSEKIFSFKRDREVTQSEMEQSAQMRPLFAIVAWNMFKDRPMLGCGFGQYAKAKYPYLKDPYSGKPLSITKSLMQHNVFLAYLTELGLVGISVLLIMLIQMGRVSWKVWRDRSLDLWARQFGLLSLVLLASYLLNGMFHDVSIIPMQHMLLFFVFGLVNNVYSKAEAFEFATIQSVAQRSAESGRTALGFGSPAV